MWPQAGATVGVLQPLLKAFPCSLCLPTLRASRQWECFRTLMAKKSSNSVFLCNFILNISPFFRENKSSLDEDLLLNQADEVKLQIKCGRCQITAQSFAEIKFHLLYVHGEEIQGRLQEESSPGSQAAGKELARHAAPSWKQHPESRKLLQHCPSDEEVHAVPAMTRQPYLHPQNDKEMLTKHEGAQLRPSKPGEVPQGPACPSPHADLLQSPSGFNCILCAQTLGRKEELLLHWEQGHNCEDPPRLWTILHALSNQGATELPSKTET